MIPPVAVAVTLALLVAAVAGMGVSWRLRARRQRGLILPPPPADPGEPRLVVEGLHLATTFAGRPLDRVVAGGLGFRARCRITVTDTGVLLEPVGADPLFLPADRLTGAGTATWTLDRSVERDGLTLLAWTLEEEGLPVPVESSFRLDLDARADLLDAVRALLASEPHPEVPHAES